jgi:hypothetical protein
MMCVPNFIKIRHAVFELKYEDSHDQPCTSSFHAHHEKNTKQVIGYESESSTWETCAQVTSYCIFPRKAGNVSSETD